MKIFPPHCVRNSLFAMLLGLMACRKDDGPAVTVSVVTVSLEDITLTIAENPVADTELATLAATVENSDAVPTYT